MRSTFFALPFFLLLLSTAGFAVISDGSMKIYAVTTEGTGLVATLHLEIDPGTGKVWSAVTPLVGTSTQGAEKTAVDVAKDFYSGTGSYDYKFTIDSGASVVEGPSAGAAMTLLTVSMLTDRKVPDDVSMTGTINPDGSIGPVGGVFEKAEEASKTGVKLFIIPKGEAVQTVKLPDGVKSVNIVDYGPKNWGMKVVEAGKVQDALKLAFSDISKIDVNSSPAQYVPDFVPAKSGLPPGLEGFKELTTGYISATKQSIGEARNALSSSLLDDAQVTQSLLEVLNESEAMISSAEILDEQNYLYSAANYAYLARVNSILVKEVSTNPSLLEDNSTELDLKLAALGQDMDAFGSDLSGDVPKSGVEWYASAQQRFTYAKITLKKLREEQSTYVVGATKEEQTASAMQKLQDYSFAVAWLDVSKDFYNLARQGDGYARRPGSLAPLAQSMLSEAQKSAPQASGNGQQGSDITRRLGSAADELDSNWFEASMLDSASVKALSESQALAAGKSHDELKKILGDKVAETEKMLSDSNSGWAMLYLDHAKYFQASAQYYDDQNMPLDAVDDMKSGIGLALFAEETSRASAEISKAYAAQPAISGNSAGQATAQGGSGKSQGGSAGLVVYGTLALLFAFCMVLLIVLIAVMHARNRAMAALPPEEREAMARHVLAIDNYNAEIRAHQEKLHDLRKHLSEGTLSAEQAGQKSGEYMRELDDLRAKLQAEIGSAGGKDAWPGAGQSLPSEEGTLALTVPPRKSPGGTGKEAKARKGRRKKPRDR